MCTQTSCIASYIDLVFTLMETDTKARCKVVGISTPWEIDYEPTDCAIEHDPSSVRQLTHKRDAEIAVLVLLPEARNEHANAMALVQMTPQSKVSTILRGRLELKLGRGYRGACAVVGIVCLRYAKARVLPIETQHCKNVG